MKRRLLFLLLLTTPLLMAACNLEGVGGFTPDGNRVALVHDGNRLYTDNPAGGSTAMITDDLASQFGTSFNREGTKILYFDSAKESICIADAEGGGTSVCNNVSLPSSTAQGGLSFLPNGHVILVFQEDDKFELRIYDKEWDLVLAENEFNQFFLSTNVYKVKRGEEGSQWYLRPYDPSGRPLRWVITRGEDAFAFTATESGVGGPNALQARFSSAVQATLTDRDFTDISSGAVSPDGNTLVFRTGSEETLYSLYVMDLTRSDGHFEELVAGANFRVRYAFSPDGQEIAYESNEGGRSVWLASADGSNRRKLADDASLPEWHE